MKRRRLQRAVVPLSVLTLAVAAVVCLLGGELLSDPFDPGLAWRPDATLAGAPSLSLRPRGVMLEAHARRAGEPLRHKAEGRCAAVAAPPLDPAAHLAAVDAELREQAPDDVLSRLLARLAGPLPGPAYEVETIRLGLLARIGALPGPAAERALCDWVGDDQRPRPERLMAIEQLAARQVARTHDLEAIAAADHDVVVQRRAQWAMQRLRGDSNRGGS